MYVFIISDLMSFKSEVALENILYGTCIYLPEQSSTSGHTCLTKFPLLSYTSTWTGLLIQLPVVILPTSYQWDLIVYMFLLLSSGLISEDGLPQVQCREAVYLLWPSQR